MRILPELDGIVAELAEPLLHSADVLLDLRQWAHLRENAGGCVMGYFDLLESIASNDPSGVRLNALREWLERSLEIAVTDDHLGVQIESLRFSLHEIKDIEQFCQRTMTHLREDRCHAARRLNLEFRFVNEIARAA